MSKKIAGQLKVFITYLREEEKSPKTICGTGIRISEHKYFIT